MPRRLSSRMRSLVSASILRAMKTKLREASSAAPGSPGDRGSAPCPASPRWFPCRGLRSARRTPNRRRSTWPADGHSGRRCCRGAVRREWCGCCCRSARCIEEAVLHDLQPHQAKADGKYPKEKQRGKDVKPSTWRLGSARPHSLFTPFRCASLRRRRSSKHHVCCWRLHAEGGPLLADRRFACTVPGSAGFVRCPEPASS